MTLPRPPQRRGSSLITVVAILDAAVQTRPPIASMVRREPMAIGETNCLSRTISGYDWQYWCRSFWPPDQIALDRVAAEFSK